MSFKKKPVFLHNALSSAIALNTMSRPDYEIKVPTVKPKFNPGGMTIYDFLYAFGIAYGMMVKDAELNNKKPMARETFLLTWCDKKLKEKALADQAHATACKILKAKGTETQMSDGKWVNASMFIYDAWFDLLIGKRHRTKNAIDVPEAYIQKLNEAATTYATMCS